MKKILSLLFVLYAGASLAQSLSPYQWVNSSNRNQRFGRGIWQDGANDSIIFRSNTIQLLGSFAVGGATDSLISIDPVTGILERRPQVAGSSDWTTTGNAGTNSGTNFIGTTDAISFRFRTNNAQRMHLDSIGRLGIGTISPLALLEVSNLIQFHPTNFTTRLGEGAGSGNTGNYGTFVGYHAGFSSPSGERNTLVGYAAGSAITSGQYNIYMGVGAGQFTTTTSDNTGIGTGCLQNNAGSDNTAVGKNCMLANTSGAQNDNFGVDNFANNTTGTYNASFGGGAGHSNSTGDTNTFLGVDAGRYNIRGGINVAVGTNASPVLIVPFDNLTGSFTVGEGVTNSTAGGSGWVKAIVGSNLHIGGGSGIVVGWADNNNLTGLVSGATAQINGTPHNPFYTISIGSGTAGGIGTAPLVSESGEINIGNTLRGRQDITGDSTLNVVRLTGATTITQDLSFSRKDINTTAGDASTQNTPVGRFRKDTSGSSFVLTNSFITANSIISFDLMGDLTATGIAMVSYTCTGGSATIEFYDIALATGVPEAKAPAANQDVSFIIFN